MRPALLHSEVFSGVTADVNTAAFRTDLHPRLMIIVNMVEGVDGRTVVPELQFNGLANGAGSWTSGTRNNVIGGSTVAVSSIQLTIGSFTASGAHVANFPNFGPWARVFFTVTGGAGSFTSINVSVYGTGV